MAFTVEDGTGLAAANSGCSVADADAYHALRGTPAAEWADLAQAVKEQKLQAATRYVDESGKQDGCHWLGSRATTTQRLAVPRSGLYTPDSLAIASNVVPEFYRDAVAEEAWALGQEDRLAAIDAPAEQSLSVGRLSVSFAAGAGSGSRSLLSAYVRSLLAPYQFQGPVR